MLPFLWDISPTMAGDQFLNEKSCEPGISLYGYNGIKGKRL